MEARRALFALVLCSGFAGAAAPEGKRPTAADYAGKWDIVIVNTGDTFRSCSLALAEREGGLLGEMVWRWGSVWKIDRPGIVTVNESGDLLVRRGEWAEPLALRRFGDMLEGSVKQKNGPAFQIIGMRAVDKVDIAGTWDVAMQFGDRTDRGSIELVDLGGGRFEAEVRREDAEKLEAKHEEFKLEGNKLTYTTIIALPSGETVRIPVAIEFKGDRLAGTMQRSQGQERTFEGTRRRAWSEPIQLLAANGLAGWHPRDSRKKFEWSCQDGVLTNVPGTVDIVSDATFKDFKLRLEYKVEEKSNSGVYLRGRYEVQILDDYGQPVESHGNGAVYSRIPQKKNVSKAPGEWQTYEITLVDRYVTVVLNGEMIIDNARLEGITGGALDPFESLPGPLMLQGDHGKVWYRNVQVQTPRP